MAKPSYLNKEQIKFFRQIQKKFSITYYYSTCFFPKSVREKVWILYSFLRIVDEIVDNPVTDPQTTLRAFQEEFWKEWSCCEERPRKTSFINFAETAEKKRIILAFIQLSLDFEFKKEWVAAFFHSMNMDLVIQRYQNEKELLRYVYGSAEVVGLMMNKLMGGSVEGEEAARKLGRAMQLTNFLRDIKEDFGRGRIYIPLENLDRFKITEQLFQQGSSKAFQDLLQFEIEKVITLYAEVLKKVSDIPKPSRLAVLLATYVYMDLLERIAKGPSQLWSKNFKKTFWSFPKAFLKSFKLLRRYRKTADFL